MKTILEKLMEKPYTTVNGEPIVEEEKVFDISNLKPQELFEILNFIQNDIYLVKNPGFFFVVWRSKYVVSIPNIHEVHIAGIEGNTLIFHGFTHEDGTGEVKITIPYTTIYPKNFSVKIITTHHLMEEFFQEVIKT